MSWSGPEIETKSLRYDELSPLDRRPFLRTLYSSPADLSGAFTFTSKSATLRNIKPNQQRCVLLFPLLPAEIRCRIWQLLLPGSRIVKVRSYAKVVWHGPPYIDHPKHKGKLIYSLFHSSTKPPTILFVNRESRAEAQRHYQLSFGFNHPLLPSTIWFDFKLDTLYFEFTRYKVGNTELINFTPEKNHVRCKYVRNDIRKVERLALCHRAVYLNSEPLNLGWWAQFLDEFKLLQELIIGIESRPVSNSAHLEHGSTFAETIDLRAKLMDEEALRLGRAGFANRNLPVPNFRVMEVVNE